MDIAEVKRKARTAASKRRAEAHERLKDAAGSALAARGLPSDLAAGIVSGFIPYKSEITSMPLMNRLRREGWQTALPVVIAAEQPLVFRAWTAGEPLVPGVSDIPIPPATAAEVLPDVLLVPMLAFDRRGYRLGYGGGFYDRTLEKLRALKKVVAIGVAYHAQMVAEVPLGPHDAPLDYVMTGRGLRVRLVFLGDVVGRAGRDALAREMPLLAALVARPRDGQRRERRPRLRHHRGDLSQLPRRGCGCRDARQPLPSTSARRWSSSSASPTCCGRSTGLGATPGAARPSSKPRRGQRVLVMQAMGRVMIEPMLDDPFPAVERELDACPLGQACDAVLIDFHAEATSEKMAFGHFCDGRASLVVGTHTHVPTADHQILPGGTA